MFGSLLSTSMFELMYKVPVNATASTPPEFEGRRVRVQLRCMLLLLLPSFDRIALGNDPAGETLDVDELQIDGCAKFGEYVQSLA